jgi:ribosomal protein S27AE
MLTPTVADAKAFQKYLDSNEYGPCPACGARFMATSTARVHWPECDYMFWLMSRG